MNVNEQFTIDSEDLHHQTQSKCRYYINGGVVAHIDLYLEKA